MEIETVDGWERLPGSWFVGPLEFHEQLESGLVRSLGLSDMVDQTLLDALASAADDDDGYSTSSRTSSTTGTSATSSATTTTRRIGQSGTTASSPR